MKIETLNIWGGQILRPLIEHIKRQSKDIDIFCFQEVFEGDIEYKPIVVDAVMNIFTQLAHALPNHQGYFSPSQINEEGLAIFTIKSLPLIVQGDLFVYRWKDAMENGDARTLGRNMQYVQFVKHGKQITVANIHGLWNGHVKTDTPERIEQSKNVKSFLDNQVGSKILCGDFNLLPDTESLNILEQDMRNLIKEYKVVTTRSNYYKRVDKYADYILVSPEINVTDFKVIQKPVSDHLALQLDFE